MSSLTNVGRIIARCRALAGVILLAFVPLSAKGAGPASLAEAYVGAIKQINERHARRPGKNMESELARRVPRSARLSLTRLLRAQTSPELGTALLRCGEAALDLDLMDDVDQVRVRLKRDFPAQADALGVALSRPRVVLRGLGGLDDPYLEHFAVVFETILDGYDEVFGFAEWSKVPGKKLRVRLHLEEKITRPPHFAPQFPFHSEIDFPVVDRQRLKSPTPDGKFLFYGLCHELGHVIAMWGDRNTEEDHHAWAHYTGVVLVEELTQKQGDKPFMKELRDGRWRSLSKVRQSVAEQKPSLADRDGVLALLVQLHDAVGPQAIGTAINELDKNQRNLRINRVRYYRFAELKKALLRVVKSKGQRAVVEKIFSEL